MPPDTTKPPKTFASIMDRSHGRFESYEEQRTKRPRVYRDSDHEKHHESLERCGNWCESFLFTLSVDFEVYDPRWLIRAWRRTLRRYDKLRPGETVKYHITANRGVSGTERASAHLIFANEDPFPDLTALRSCWEDETRGGNWKRTTAGHRASLYQSQNATEPGAREEQWNLKLSKAELRSGDGGEEQQRASEKPCEPIPEQDDPGAEPDPKARWKAEVERRRARNVATRKARKAAREAADAAVLAQNDRAKPRPEAGATAAQGAGGAFVPGQRVLIPIRLEKRRVRTRMDWGHIKAEVTCLFRDGQGQPVLWTGKNPSPMNVKGYHRKHKHLGRHPILRGVELHVSAKVKAVEADGTVVLSRPYFRLDRQPEQTRRAYVERCGVAPSEVGLDGE